MTSQDTSTHTSLSSVPVEDALRDRVLASVNTELPSLITLSEKIHATPELGWQEHQAADWTATYLQTRGFTIERNYLNFSTAIRATYGTGTRRIGLMAEYDALPGLGHACGHNIITATSIGAACALSQFAHEYDLSIELYGTPAEEGGGGKIELLKKGAFAGLDLAMMVHPSPVDSAVANPFAVAHQHVQYRGKSAHAAAYPDQGINANDAFLIAQMAIGLLRQQLPQETRVHGVQTRGGEAPNAIPEITQGRWYVRAETLAELSPLNERVNKCFEAGALATGCELEITPESEPYSEFRTDERALEIYTRHAQALGRSFDAPPEQATMNRASTDMGNVSQIVPAIHPYIGLGCFPAANHQPEFATHCIGEAANLAIHDGAIALALTALEYTGTPQSSPRTRFDQG